MIASALRLSAKRRVLLRPTARLVSVGGKAALPFPRRPRAACRRTCLAAWRAAGSFLARGRFSDPHIAARRRAAMPAIPPPRHRRPGLDRPWRG